MEFGDRCELGLLVEGLPGTRVFQGDTDKRERSDSFFSLPHGRPTNVRASGKWHWPEAKFFGSEMTRHK